MARVQGYVRDQLVYDQECEMSERNQHIMIAYAYGDADDINDIVVEVTDDDGSIWTPI
jgi:hypothetical protein